MESQEQRDLKMRISRTETTLNQKGCKNGNWLMIADHKTEGGYRPVVTGCPNQRRNGSAYCQECSDKHIKK